MLEKKKYIIVLDQGTTSSKVIIIDNNINIINISKKKFSQFYPKPGWVEHDPIEIWESQNSILLESLNKLNIKSNQIACIGITNQRETTVVWDKKTGIPIYNAIVWQCRRTIDICNKLKKDGLEEYIKKVTGLIIDPYFSGTKITWILDNVHNARSRAIKGELLFGTIDSWLVWKMTKGKIHITDYTNASRTMLFDIHKLKWDNYLLNIMNIPFSMMPSVKSSSEIYGQINIFKEDKVSIPISGIAGDQQASLYGHLCVKPGMTKNTYGTGCFLLMNTGTKAIQSNNGLLTTIACGPFGEINYALEGSVFIAGSLIQWLKDEIKLINDINDIEYIVNKVKNSNGVYIVPAFTGLGAPYWDPYARGSIFGITRGVNINHIVRATLESIAFQTRDLVESINKDFKCKITSLKVDGGIVSNNFLMQFQSNILGISIERLKTKEVTALGVAYLAGLAVGFWNNLEEINNKNITKNKFYPNIKITEINSYYKKWKDAISRTIGWKNKK